MKFSVPHNWQNDLLPRMNAAGIEQVYAKLAHDFVGGGRASYMLPHIAKNKAAKYISDARQRGISFNYLLNSNCLGNREWTIKGQRELTALLDWLVDVGVDSVTVSIPYLLELIKARYPKLKVGVSTQAGVDSIKRARYWEDLGADRITLAEISVNRNFPLLSKIRSCVKCELQLIANLDCLSSCPFWTYHAALNSHGSQDGHPSGGFLIDYCSIACNYIRLKNPVEFIRAGWIRPEDVHYYESIGIDSIKLVNRTLTTDALLLIINAYANGRYEGNLLDLFPRTSKTKNIMLQKPNILHKVRYFFHPFRVNLFALLEARKLLGDMKVYIDNRSLDGFITRFLDKSCDLESCDDCGYCHKIAEKSVNISPGWQEKAVANYRRYLDSLTGGKMFKYSASLFK